MNKKTSTRSGGIDVRAKIAIHGKTFFGCGSCPPEPLGRYLKVTSKN
jgi:hypothetical protein